MLALTKQIPAAFFGKYPILKCPPFRDTSLIASLQPIDATATDGFCTQKAAEKLVLQDLPERNLMQAIHQ